MADKLKSLFEPPLTSLRLISPPPDPDDTNAAQTGITAWQFPEWFITQDVDAEKSAGTRRARMLVHRTRLAKGKFINDNKKKCSVVPVRFVRACKNGHISDIDWYMFLHGPESNCRRQLWMEERGTSGDWAEVYIRCECGNAERCMVQAAELPQLLGHCDGRRPWLGAYGILLFTGTSDAEGTLGGLIQVGSRIHEHLRNALELGFLCSNDPVCAQHEPTNAHECRFLQGAACRGCLLISETSCEQHNEYLDRALVVSTVDNLGTEFFKLD